MRVPPNEVDLHLCLNETDLEAFRSWTPDGVVSCDIETTGLQPFGNHADKIRLVQFGDENTGWAIPFERSSGSNHWVIREAMERFRGRIVNHNSRFDESFLEAAGIDTGPQWEDTYIMHHLLYPDAYHGLKPVAGAFYGREVRAGEKWLDKIKTKNHWDWASVPIEHPAYWGYAAMDTCLSARIYNDMLPEMGRVKEQYARELRVSRLMANVTKTGMVVDTLYAEDLVQRWYEEEQKLRAVLEKYAIKNPGSGPQVATALINEGWEPDVLTETGKPSVNKDVLAGLDHEIAKTLLRWRRVSRWSKVYAQPMVQSGGRLHANISSLRAATGRMSVSEPPLQQLPRGPEVRSCLLADAGTEMWATDYTGQEARLLAAYVGDDAFTDEVLNGGDIHGNIARNLFGDDYTPEQRANSKNGFYAYAYGAEDKRLAATTKTSKGEFKEAVRAAYPAIAGFMESVIETGRARHKADGMAWAKTLGGRTVAVPKTRIYALTNYIMQGGGSDLMKIALEKIDDAGLSDTVRLVVHDEVLSVQPPGPEGEEAARTIAECMQNEFRGVPFDAHSTGPGKSWGDVS